MGKKIDARPFIVFVFNIDEHSVKIDATRVSVY